MKCIKTPLLSLLQDQSISLDIVDTYSSSEIKNGFRRLSIRVESILNTMIKMCNQDDLPYPLLLFIKTLTGSESYVPDDFLTKFEIHRVNLTNYGALKNATKEQKQMIIGFFLIGKALVINVLLNPQSLAQNITLKEKAVKNLKIIASVIWLAFLKYIRTVCRAIDPENDDEFKLKNGKKYRKAPTDTISEELFDQRDLSHIFQREKKWFNHTCIRIAKFLENYIELTEKFDEVKRIQENK